MSNVKAIDLLTQHFERQRGQSYTVPGVVGADGVPLVVYFDPVTNAAAQAVRRRAGDDEAALTLYTVVYLAKDKDGAPLFEDNASTIRALKEGVMGSVLAQIAQAIMSQTSGDDLGN